MNGVVGLFVPTLNVLALSALLGCLYFFFVCLWSVHLSFLAKIIKVVRILSKGKITSERCRPDGVLCLLMQGLGLVSSF